MELIKKYEVPKLKHPQLPPESPKTAYAPIEVEQYLSFPEVLEQIPSSSIFQSENLVTMEALDMNDGSGQSYGYIVYETIVEFKQLTASLTVI